MSAVKTWRHDCILTLTNVWKQVVCTLSQPHASDNTLSQWHASENTLSQQTLCVFNTPRANLAALPTNTPECSHRVWSRNGREGCSDLPFDISMQMVYIMIRCLWKYIILGTRHSIVERTTTKKEHLNEKWNFSQGRSSGKSVWMGTGILQKFGVVSLSHRQKLERSTEQCTHTEHLPLCKMSSRNSWAVLTLRRDRQVFHRAPGRSRLCHTGQESKKFKISVHVTG